MHDAAAELRFEYAARLRDEIRSLRRELAGGRLTRPAPAGALSVADAGDACARLRSVVSRRDAASTLCRSRGPRAQPQEHLARAAPRPAHRLHRAVRVGEVVARLRHHLRRGPAPLRRVAVGVRPAVPRPDGQARRRLHRGAVAGDLDRPEVRVAQPPLDGRHDHRDLRLPAAALRPHRACRTARTADGSSPARRPSRSSTGSWSCPRAPGSRCSRRSCAAARASTTALLDELADAGLRPGPRRRRASSSSARPDRARAGPLRAAHDRGRRRPARPPAPASSAG